MDYTKNYHLPQWKKEDRIMMEDFNQMCADIEAGLDRTARDAAAASAQIKADSTAAEALASSRLYRLTYNHYCTAHAVDPFPRQIGAFCQDYTKDGSAAGMLRIDDFLWTGGNQSALTYAELLEAVTQTSHITNDSDTCTVLFTPPKAAWLATIQMTSLYSTSVAGIRTGTLRLYDQTEDRCVAARDITFNIHAGSGSSIFYHPVNCSIAAGHSYRLDIFMNRTDLTSCDIYLPLSPRDAPFTLKSTGGGEPAPFTYHFQEDTGSSGGLFLVHYVPAALDNGLVLAWDGKEYTPTTVRTITDNQGRTLQEAEFLIERQVPADSTVSLRLDCGGGRRAFCFYDWGGILFG